MKNFFKIFVITSLFLLPAVALAYTPGSYTAKVSLNIRSMPSMSGQLLSYYHKGSAVQVLSADGSWCRVPFGTVHAYVYCPDLLSSSGFSVAMTPALPISAPTDGVVTQALQSAQNWLQTNSVGTNYINDSYAQALPLAKAWDQSAQIADFYFQWPLLADAKCSMTFTSPLQLHTAYQVYCFDGTGALKPSVVNVTTPQKSYNLPTLLFKDYLARMLNDQSLMAQLDGYFSQSPSVTGLFRLYKNAQGVQLWEGKFINQLDGKFMIVSTDASQSNAPLQVVSGLYQ